jgi:hypothetical protein
MTYTRDELDRAIEARSVTMIDAVFETARC